ncbi:MAG TPA: pyruvate dehydrogenase (acetyl-transferring) E1 component subunit alpha [Gammaproteobacteria bacterium]|nr:pyruvate dehydrogenase (acetyl-transferring) E1 component subunit alpha [Gammaproteobacteria bacterium]
MKIVAQFEIPWYQYLNEQSELAPDAPTFARDTEHLIHLYREMVMSRTFDTKAIALQRTGKMGTYPSTRGQEAVFVGMGDAMPSDDIFIPYYRDVATLIQRGVNPVDILMYWGGDERGNTFADPTHNFPYAVPIGTQILHAAGVATALKIRGQKHAVLAVCGDGGTSEGDFYEAMNVAGIWKLPIVFVVSNNQWAISVPRSEQTAAKTIAQKAIAAGFSGEQVDGNDIIAVRARVVEALKKAREQHEPTLIEMVCYRQSDHTTADDASRYEPKALRETEWKKEPVARLRHYLEKIKAWSPEKEKALLEECVAKTEKIVQDYLAMPPALPVSMFEYLYETLPDAYADQRDALMNQGT